MAIELKNQIPLTLAQIDDSDRIMVIDMNDTVVAVTTFGTLADYVKSDIDISDVMGLQVALNAKADLDHTHLD